jgi:uncharacterized protein YijF (DUF1287 family)
MECGASPRFGFSCLLLAFCFAAALHAQTLPPFGQRLAQAAETQVGKTTVYDPAYVKLAYPGGDIPLERGVCADVVVRAFRAEGLDLQKLVHEDMARAFKSYPQAWGLQGPDTNIDHRRVLNLQCYFERRGWKLPLSQSTSDYLPGDVVAWRLPGSNLPHIGVVSARKDSASGRPLVVHNVGAGAQCEDVLFAYNLKGHYRKAE